MTFVCIDVHMRKMYGFFRNTAQLEQSLLCLSRCVVRHFNCHSYPVYGLQLPRSSYLCNWLLPVPAWRTDDIRCLCCVFMLYLNASQGIVDCEYKLQYLCLYVVSDLQTYAYYMTYVTCPCAYQWPVINPIEVADNFLMYLFECIQCFCFYHSCADPPNFTWVVNYSASRLSKMVDFDVISC